MVAYGPYQFKVFMVFYSDHGSQVVVSLNMIVRASLKPYF